MPRSRSERRRRGRERDVGSCARRRHRPGETRPSGAQPRPARKGNGRVACRTTNRVTQSQQPFIRPPPVGNSPGRISQPALRPWLPRFTFRGKSHPNSKTDPCLATGHQPAPHKEAPGGAWKPASPPRKTVAEIRERGSRSPPDGARRSQGQRHHAPVHRRAEASRRGPADTRHSRTVAPPRACRVEAGRMGKARLADCPRGNKPSNQQCGGYPRPPKGCAEPCAEFCAELPVGTMGGSGVTKTQVGPVKSNGNDSLKQAEDIS